MTPFVVGDIERYRVAMIGLLFTRLIALAMDRHEVGYRKVPAPGEGK